MLEYTIQDLKGGKAVDLARVAGPIQALTIRPGRNVHTDIAYLYTNVILGYPGSDTVKLAVQTILYSKHFVKEWPLGDEDDDSLMFVCRLTRGSIDFNAELSQDFPPREYIMVPLYATVGDLKIAVQKAMRDTYYVMEKLQVTDIVEMEGVQDEEVLFGIAESGMELLVRGCG